MRQSGDKSSTDVSEAKDVQSNLTYRGCLGETAEPRSEEQKAQNAELDEKLVLETSRTKPDRKKMKKLTKATFTYQRNWILTSPAPSISEVSEKFILFDTLQICKLILSKQKFRTLAAHTQNVVIYEQWSKFCHAHL